MKVEALDVPRVLSSYHLHAVLPIALLMEVNSVEFTLELRPNVLQLKVLIHCNEAPMTHLHSFGGFSENELRVCRLEQKLDEIKTKRSHVVIRPILNTTVSEFSTVFIAVHFRDTGRWEEIHCLLGVHQVRTQKVP